LVWGWLSGIEGAAWPMAGTWRTHADALGGSPPGIHVCEKASGKFGFHRRNRQIRRDLAAFYRAIMLAMIAIIQIAYESVAASRIRCPSHMGEASPSRCSASATSIFVSAWCARPLTASHGDLSHQGHHLMTNNLRAVYVHVMDDAANRLANPRFGGRDVFGRGFGPDPAVGIIGSLS